MSTRALIGKLTGLNGIYPMGEGVYHHWDGYPAELGAVLFDLSHTKYRGDMKRMFQEIVDSHPGGWSDLKKGDCYCHTRGSGVEGYELRDLNWAIQMNCHWAYLFAFENGEPIMVVAHRMARWSPAFLEPLEEWWAAGGHRAAERR
jgi:hypothetical protein